LSRRVSIFLVVIVVLGGAIGAIYFTRGSKENSKKNPAFKAREVSNEGKTEEAPKEGFLSPQFSLYDLSGSLVRLSDFKEKVVLLNFWATWCSPCKREIPSLLRLYQLRKDKGFEIVAVTTERASTSQIASFAERYQMSFPILLNPRADVGSKYWVRAIPTSFLLDKNGVIRWKIIGGREWDDPYVLSRIDQLLAE
jgi:cytochrome c biogenesis protein CcmG/thiol:disulfide interchange protein DsbE